MHEPDVNMDGFRVIVCGGRDFEDADYVFAKLDRLHLNRRITQLSTGDARGADRIARQWAITRGVFYLGYPADWRLYGNRAGPVRNEQMLREVKPHAVVAFPGGSGTGHMVSIAKRDRVTVWDLRDKYSPKA